MSAWLDLSELASSQHGCFSRRQAAEFGIDAHALQREATRGTVHLCHPTVFRVAAAPRTWQQQLMAAVLTRPGAFASHRSAARLHGFGEFTHDPTVEICFARGNFHQLDGVVVHRWRRPSDRDITEVDGIPVATKAATLIHLGVATTRKKLLHTAIEAIPERVHPIWLDQTLERLNRPGRTGRRQLLDVLTDRAFQPQPVESVLEMMVDEFASRAGLPPLERQIPVTADGRIYRIDLGYSAISWGLEATSRAHHFGREAEARDSVRHLRLAAVGWQVEYFTWWAAHEPERFADLLVAAVTARCKTLGVDLDALRSGWVDDTSPPAA
ncbi:MAG: hypothetical protein ACRBI6_05970 [Acidimicrobiales bacterium]